MSHVITHFDEIEAVPFPGRIVKAGDTDKETVKAIQRRLNALGCGPITEDGVFDKERTEKGVKLFQARFTDIHGQPLERDGKVGQLTWGAMFGADTVPSSPASTTALMKAAIDFAETQLHVREHPLGDNRGPEVDVYLRTAGVGLGEPWCVAFTYYCYEQGAKKIGIPNPHIKTGHVLTHWNKARTNPKIRRVTKAKALANPGLIKPGCLFIIETNRALQRGHTGLVVKAKDGRLVTIEGNTNSGLSREGIGVFKQTERKINHINMGFIDYSAF